MNLFKTLLYAIVLLILALYVGGFKLSLHPFRIGFGTWYNLIGWVLAIAALTFLNLGSYRDGYIKGAEDMTKEIKIHIEQKIAERQAIVNHSEIHE